MRRDCKVNQGEYERGEKEAIDGKKGDINSFPEERVLCPLSSPDIKPQDQLDEKREA